MLRRAIVLLLSLLAVIAVVVIAIVVRVTTPEGKLPDTFEQALVDALDASEVVASHDAGLGRWEHPVNVAPPEARVTLADGVTVDAGSRLIQTLIAVSTDHDQSLPAFEFQRPEGGATLRVEGNLADETVADLVDLASALDEIDRPVDDDSVGFTIATSGNDAAPTVTVRTRIRSDQMRDADEDQRAEVAEELGYVAFCDAVADLARTRVTNAATTTQCTAGSYTIS